ncbi:nucleolar complex protein 4 [Achlya hypogyna]|uniref:Nucleolar complex protein 4 n=1 Tax=Achlya hypogyna TaxID=1202772 RepID=A0A1V9Z9Q3_ACHHY|nr:nucleolar complex protein 4 [Achlya hypogyna]
MNVKIAALRTLMDIVARENVFKGTKDEGFGTETYNRLARQLMLSAEFNGELLSVFKGEFVSAYLDVQYYTVPMKTLTVVLDTTKTTPSSPLVHNALAFLMDMVTLPDAPEEITSFLVAPKKTEADLALTAGDDSDESDDDDDDEDTVVNAHGKRPAQGSGKSKNTSLYNPREHQRAFSACWIALLKHQLPEESYKAVLAKLPNEVMPYLVNPILLADFLTDSYNVGGITSLLALNSLFLLIQQFNFDYPDFFPKLYALVGDASLLRSKYRKRFFKLLNLFLSSTHLPAYLVAAFAKRLARVALTAEPGAILFIIPMVYNLVVRHKECTQLIHRTSVMSVAEKAAERREQLQLTNSVDAAAAAIAKEATKIQLKGGRDPFDSKTNDPAACHALQSSLWEVVSLTQHYHATVQLKAKMFEEKIRSQMLDVTPDMDIQYAELVEAALKRRENQSVPLAFEPCTGVFAADDVFASVFAV